MNIMFKINSLKKYWRAFFYDFLLWATFPEKKIKKATIAYADFSPTQNVLDYGCGTGTLLLMIKRKFPEINLTGIDVSQEMVGLAKHKIKKENIEVPVFKYDGKTLPFPDNSFKKIVSSFVFHHLSTRGKRDALKELYRVLKTDSQFCITDFGKGKNLFTTLSFQVMRLLDGYENTLVNAKGLIPQFISETGFKKIEQKKVFNTLWGSVYIWIAVK